MARKLPYTNFHDLNLDWIIKRIKNVYNDENPPPYPVKTVNGQVGNVHLTGDDIPVSPNDNTVISTRLAEKYTKPVGGIPLSDLAQTVINTINAKYTKPVGGIPASDLAQAVIDAINAKYTKPVNGIPLSDLDPDIITDIITNVVNSIIDDNAGYGDTDKTWSADKLMHLDSDVLQNSIDINDLETADSDFNIHLNAIKSRTVTTNITEWTQGSLKVSDGKTQGSTTRCRNNEYICGADLFHDGIAILSIKTGFSINVLAYNFPDLNVTGAFEGAIFSAFQQKEVILQENVSPHSSKNFWYRITIRKNDDSTLTPADLPEDVLYYYIAKREKNGIDRNNTYGQFKRFRFTVPVNMAPYGQSDNIQKVQCILQLPSTYKAIGKPTPLIMVGHGGDGYVSQTGWVGATNFGIMVDNFCAQGYALFDVNNTANITDGSTVPDEGCLTLMQSYINAWEYIKRYYNVTDDLYLLGYSMGSFAVLNMLKWYGSKIKTAIITAPRVSIGEIYSRLDSTQKAHIASVFSWGSVPANYSDVENLMIGWDPYLNLINISNNYVLKDIPPIKVMVGTGDTTQLTEVRNFFSAFSNNGNVIMYGETANATHAQMSYLATEALRSEAISWMNRFKEG